MKKLALVLTTAVALLYLGSSGFLYFEQRSLLYRPMPASIASGAERITVKGPDTDLLVWSVPGSGPDAPIYFGGNAEDVTKNVPGFAESLPEQTVYLPCYRGYCSTNGEPSEAALFADALAVYDAVKARHTQIAVAGRSLGSGVAVYLATERPVERLVLVTPYDSVASVAAAHYPIFPVRWLLKDRFDSLARAPRLNVPVLVLLSETDEVVPHAHSQQLIAALKPGQVQVRTLRGVNHNTLRSSQDYFPAIRDFLRR